MVSRQSIDGQDKAEQLDLFDQPNASEQGEEQDSMVEEDVILSPAATLAEALDAFDQVMLLKGFTDNTIKAFQADLRILAEYLSPDHPIAGISARDLRGFLAYLLRGRSRPCNPKSYARRITTLKVFFGWLAEAGALQTDPAAKLVHRPVQTPLPRVLSEEEIARLIEAGRWLATGGTNESGKNERGDPRPILLVELLLQTGIKKSECMGIHLAHLDLSNPQEPLLHVRYEQVRQKYKERTIRLQPHIASLLRAYRERYKPAEYLFECTARNLEYVLRDLAVLADIPGGVSFESLRWTAALREYRNGKDADALRRKLGLSKLRWRETLEKLEQLATPAL